MQALGEFYVLNYLGALRQRDFSTCSGEWRAPAALLLIPAAADPHLLSFLLNIWEEAVYVPQMLAEHLRKYRDDFREVSAVLCRWI